VRRTDGKAVAPAGWFQDPEHRHQWRYWDGTAWTDHVADDGQQSRAPLGAPPAPVADDAARERAVQELARTADPSVIPALREALGDSSFVVRSAAIKALGEMGPPAIETLLDEAMHASTGPDPYGVRSYAIQALGTMGPAAVEPLLHAVQHAEYDKVRQHAASALGRIGDPRAVDALISACSGSFTSAKGYTMWDPQIAEAAVRALGQIGDPRAVGPLAHVARNGQDSILGWSVGPAADGIRKIFASRLSEVCDDALRDVAALDDVFKQPLQYAGYGGHEMVELRNHVDCSDIQTTARQELASRGQ